ncbi:MAG: hypothetical protein ABIP61_01275 [Burkholderiaceae bacterium]
MNTQSVADAVPPPLKPEGRLGTFAGVFTPSILTTLGIVLFLRLGYVVGSAGLPRALLVIAAANAISVVTALSVAAVATNLRVKAGGDYYLISRTLGSGFGGAIGIVLFLAQSVSIGFYCIGFAEAVAPLLGLDQTFALHAIALVAVFALGALAWVGADLATRFQYVVMALLTAGIGSFVFGAWPRWDDAQLVANWSTPPHALPFWAAFAIFFPAVTGFTQGVSMSGDLARPSHSIPRGVFAAVGLSALVYFGVAVLFAAAAPAATLSSDPASMKHLAALRPLVDLGVMAATLSSALASFLGAPRILQSLAKDQVFPWLDAFSVVEGATGNPRRAVAPTLAVAVIVVMLGELDLIAAVVSMFFLVSYGLLNYATYYEARSGSPSFRPTFRWYHQHIALAGAVGCLAAMLAIDAVAGLSAAAIVFVIYRYLQRSKSTVRWADGRRAFHLQAAREHLLAAAAEPEHVRSWRPQLLVFSDTSARRARLLHFAAWVEGGAGLTTVVRMIAGDAGDPMQRREEEYQRLVDELQAAGSPAFPLVVVGSDADQMVASVIQTAGIGPMRINTVVANWPRSAAAFYEPLGIGAFGHHVAMAFRLGTNLVLLDATTQEWEAMQATMAGTRVIDVWWRDTRTGELMLLLAYLMTRSNDWRGASIRLIDAADPALSEDHQRQALIDRLGDMRIRADVVIVADRDQETVVSTSRSSAMVFLPFRVHAGRFYSPFGWEVGDALPLLPITALVLGAQDVDLEADPDHDPEPEPEPDSSGQPAAPPH